MKFLVDFPMTLWATEAIEAKDYDEAKEIAERLMDSERFFQERLLPDYVDCDIQRNWENCDSPEIQSLFDEDEATLTAEHIDDFIGE